jgi:hypothetical protein
VTMQTAPGLTRWERLCLALWQRDWLWWPLVFLRPAPESRAGALLVASLALAGTLLAAGVAVLACRLLQVAMPWPIFGIGVGICFVLVVGLLGLTFALPWNRRARLLQGS